MEFSHRTETRRGLMSNTRPAGAGLRILVVEDDRDTATSLDLLLQLRGYQARVAPDGPTAVRLAEQEPPDVVLLDIGLPGINGYEVARRLRAMPRDFRPLLIAVSGYGMATDRRQAAEAGIDLHWVKPADPQKLLALLDRFAGILTPSDPSEPISSIGGRTRIDLPAEPRSAGERDGDRLARRRSRTAAVVQWGRDIDAALARCYHHLGRSDRLVRQVGGWLDFVSGCNLTDRTTSLAAGHPSRG
jgi:CheY-like chemotaxis protein